MTIKLSGLPLFTLALVAAVGCQKSSISSTSSAISTNINVSAYIDKSSTALDDSGQMNLAANSATIYVYESGSEAARKLSVEPAIDSATGIITAKVPTDLEAVDGFKLSVAYADGSTVSAILPNPKEDNASITTVVNTESNEAALLADQFVSLNKDSKVPMDVVALQATGVGLKGVEPAKRADAATAFLKSAKEEFDACKVTVSAADCKKIKVNSGKAAFDSTLVAEQVKTYGSVAKVPFSSMLNAGRTQQDKDATEKKVTMVDANEMSRSAVVASGDAKAKEQFAKFTVDMMMKREFKDLSASQSATVQGQLLAEIDVAAKSGDTSTLDKLTKYPPTDTNNPMNAKFMAASSTVLTANGANLYSDVSKHAAIVELIAAAQKSDQSSAVVVAKIAAAVKTAVASLSLSADASANVEMMIRPMIESRIREIKSYIDAGKAAPTASTDASSFAAKYTIDGESAKFQAKVATNPALGTAYTAKVVEAVTNQATVTSAANGTAPTTTAANAPAASTLTCPTGKMLVGIVNNLPVCKSPTEVSVAVPPAVPASTTTATAPVATATSTTTSTTTATTTTASAGTTDAVFTNSINAIFQSRCASCHTSTSGRLFKSSMESAVATKLDLKTRVQNNTMPPLSSPQGAAMTASERASIVNWIMTK